MIPRADASEKADWYTFRLPLVHPWRHAGSTLTERHVRLLRLTDANGYSGWGEAAPWPEIGISEDKALSMAWDTARCDLAAQRAGQPLSDFLAGALPTSPTLLTHARRVAVNAALGPAASLTRAHLEAALATGFKVIKLKLGVSPLATELDKLAEIANWLPPDITLRLDANQAWSPTQAREFIRYAVRWPVESLEEPLQTPSPAMLAELQAMAPFPLALDEAIDLADEHFFRRPFVQRLIIKPPRLGGLWPGKAFIARALSAGVSCVITSSLDSACGLLAAAHLAAAVLPDSVHGLDTGHCFLRNTGDWPDIQQGFVKLPSEIGLGFVAQDNLPEA